jgi:hypothetical protein
LWLNVLYLCLSGSVQFTYSANLPELAGDQQRPFSDHEVAVTQSTPRARTGSSIHNSKVRFYSEDESVVVVVAAGFWLLVILVAAAAAA